MDKILYLQLDEGLHPQLDKLQNHYEVHSGRTFRESLICLLENPDVALIVMDHEPKSNDVKRFLKKIHILNPLLPVVIISTMVDEYIQEEYSHLGIKIFPVQSSDNLLDVLNSTFINRRKYNRVNWPLQVKFFTANKLNENHLGQIFTFSIGGAYVKTDDFSVIENKRVIFLNVSFKDFNLLVEGVIINVNTESNPNFPKGFSVQFVNVSQATSQAINNIINDKIITELFSGMEIEKA